MRKVGKALQSIQRQMKNGNFYLVIAFLIMAVLFYSSSQTYEEQSQVALLNKILAGEPFKEQLSRIAFVYADSEVSMAHLGYFKFVEFFIRKGAHFGTYFIMGWGLFVGTSKRSQGSWLAAILAWLASTGYAALDEFHQMMTGGRSPLFQDVMLDSVGAAVGILLTVLLGRLFKKRPRRRKAS